MASCLRIGFIVDAETTIPAWYFATIKTVIKEGDNVFFVLYKKERKTVTQPLLLRLFRAFEEAWFRSPFDALRPESIQHLLTEKNIVQLNGGLSAEASLEGLKRWELDVLYAIGLDEIDCKVLAKTARLGLWTVSFGTDDHTEKNPAAFWEVMHDVPVTASRLLLYKEEKVFVAYDGTTRTVPYSVKNNFNAVAWKASSYFPHRLYTLQKSGDAFFDDLPLLPIFATKGKAPRNSAMPFLVLRNIARYVGYKLKSKAAEKFTLLYSFGEFNLNTVQQLKFTPLALPQKNVFYADPFVVEKDGVNYVFFEEMDEAKGKAHISVLFINQNKALSKPQLVLEKPYHLSYPFVFLHEGGYYMIPETAGNKTVELYKATQFPYQWRFVMNLMEDVVLFDATLHFEAGKWWLFANGHNHPATSTNDQLFLFYSNGLFSNHWIPHPQNPVATHAGNCRPAGRIFCHHNKLYRPAQNNASQQYGYGLKLNEIVVLNERNYKEKEVLSLVPESLGLKACHHLDFSSSLIVMDGIVQ